MGHPLLLIDELQVAFPDAADTILVQFLDSLDLRAVVLPLQVEQGKQDV